MTVTSVDVHVDTWAEWTAFAEGQTDEPHPVFSGKRYPLCLVVTIGDLRIVAFSPTQ